MSIIIDRLPLAKLMDLESNLRQLRVYHWQQYLKRNKEADAWLASGWQENSVAVKRHREPATMHLLIVQMLNDVIDGTAENDESNGY